ncbi:MAG: sugar phosphate isomerase/epimerase [Nocardioidaceae bacterium]
MPDLGPSVDLVFCSMNSPEAEFEARVRAAASAGYTGIGLHSRHRVKALAEGRTDADLRAILDDHGVAVVELEALSGWSCEDEAELVAARDREEEIYQLADAVGGRHILVASMNLSGPRELMVERFAAICDRAAEHGLLIAFEFLPWTRVPDLAAAQQVVELAGRPNGGIELDSWHFYRGSASMDQLLTVPPELVVALQLDDALLTGDGTLLDQTWERLLPGQGELPLVEFLQALALRGIDAPLGVEIISSELAAMPVARCAELTAEAMRAVLREAFPAADPASARGRS